MRHASRAPTAALGCCVKKDDDFEAEGGRRFALDCELYKAAAYHLLKRQYVAKAYDAIEDYLDHRDIQSL